MTVWLVVLLPVIAAAGVAVVPRFACTVAVAGLGATAAAGGWAAASEATSVVSWGPRLELTAAATEFARVMVVLVPVIALPIVLYAAATESFARARLTALLVGFVGAMELLVVANDLLTLLIGWELVGAFSWILIAHHWGESSNAQKASHAFITTRFGDLGLYVAAGTAFAATGSLAFSSLGHAAGVQLDVIAGGILLAATAKSAQVPFSPWLFSAMAGPTPVSALLHSSTMVAAGAYLLVRVAPHVDPIEWFGTAIIVIGLTSALAAGIVAVVHRHPKRLLAASTTAQYGLMFVAVGAGSALAAAAQLVTHAAFKSLLFLTSGAAMHVADSEDLGEMRLGRRLPLIAVFAGIGALTLAGLPPLGGAWSKEQITAAAFERSPLLGAAVLAAVLLGAVYALRYWVLAFGAGRIEREVTVRPEVTASLGSLAALSLGLTVLWLPRVNEVAADLAPGEVVPSDAVGFALGVASLAVAVVVVAALQRRGRLVGAIAPPVVSAAAAAWYGLPTASRTIVIHPVLATARALAAFDDRVIDAGIRASARLATGLSALLRRRSEISIDALVHGVGGAVLLTAAGSSALDDHGVDRTAEGVARALGRAGDVVRKLQTGLSHHYYVIVAVGVVAVAFALAGGSS